MMRRAFATFVLTISLFIGATAWSGFLILNTVLDPGRSERMATTLLDDPDVRGQIRDNIARTIDANVPPEVPLPPGAVSDAADAALDSPAVEALVFDALVASHKALLGEGDAPASIDGGAFGAAARDELVAEYPDLEGVLPAAPSLEIPMPTERIPDLRPVRDFLKVVVPALALVAAVGATLALVITSDRPAVLRRAGFWAVGLSAMALAVAVGIPALAHRFLPDQAAVISGVIGAMAERTRLPALAMAVAGLVGIGLSFLWRPAGRAASPAPAPAPGRGAHRGERARRHGGPAPQRFDVQPPNRPRRPTGPVPPPPAGGPGRPVTPAYGTPPVRNVSSPPPAAQPPRPAAVPAPVDATRVEAVAPAPERPGARWVEDVGWVHDGDGPIPPGSRFVPGAGYVLPD